MQYKEENDATMPATDMVDISGESTPLKNRARDERYF